MRNRLDQGQPVFGGSNLALEERQETFGGGAGRGEVVQQPVQRAFVVFDHLDKPEGQAGEGQLVAGQDKLVCRSHGP